ncbi:hypothetical protein BKA82DRAFT_4200189 [Pisolithus tinctorius]|nr:hypothetical protein BKA82DRAFT_4200189 [Pisolithus tinctorius]
MKLLNVEAVLDQDKGITHARPEIITELDDQTTRYAILSHRWGAEVSYEEMIGLMKMEEHEREEIRQRQGYRKIIKSCEQAMKDGYKWLWNDTCCIDKRSSSELSEAINSIFRWYRNAQVKFSRSNGWPEWFIRGWTLQELIAPKHLEFFDKDWRYISNKRRLAPMLERITRILREVLKDGMAAKRLSVGQIMSWAADRKTTRVEDRAYSLLGLFGVNMPMLYGEGKKAFQRLQLEIIRVSNDHSIFAWKPRSETRPGSVLADDPSDFWNCSRARKVESDEFANKLVKYVGNVHLGSPRSIFGTNRGAHRRKLAALRDTALSHQHCTFSVSNAGIQVWLPILPSRESPCHFEAILACTYPDEGLVTIDLVSSGSSFERSFRITRTRKTYPEFKMLYFAHYQDVNEMHRDFALDDRNTSHCGFARCGTFPREFTGDSVTLTSLTDDLIVIVYANDDTRSRFAVGLGYYLGKGWVHVIHDEPTATKEMNWAPWSDFAKEACQRMWNVRAELAQAMPTYSGADNKEHHCDTFIKHAHLPRSIWDARVVWGRWDTDNFNVMVDVEQCPGCCNGPCEWVETSNDGDGLDIPGLMKTVCHSYQLVLDGWSVQLEECSSQQTTLGDYGSYSNDDFTRDGNIFEDMQAIGIDSTDLPYLPVAPCVSSIEYCWPTLQDRDDIVMAYHDEKKHLALHQPKGLSLPANDHFVLLLKVLCPWG